MDFSLPPDVQDDRRRFLHFLETHVKPNLHQWYREEAVPRSLIETMGSEEWLGFSVNGERVEEHSALKQAARTEEIAKLSLVHPNLTAWVIDDFYANHDVFTPAAVKEMRDRARAIQPRLAFLPLMYFGELSRRYRDQFQSQRVILPFSGFLELVRK
ncbi:MAG: acyl-CoA dehydrogenase family protein, partial [Syntrophobacteraceae bacterium]|nr:acyl-CoA dehydrogenase family protein [Syntrophobacteraceae bacterium]